MECSQRTQQTMWMFVLILTNPLHIVCPFLLWHQSYQCHDESPSEGRDSVRRTRLHPKDELPSEGLLIAHVNLLPRMVSNGMSPLTPLAQEALEALASGLPDEGDLTYEHAYTILYEKEDLERPAAEDIIERLSMMGHLYEVEGKLRLTDYRAK